MIPAPHAITTAAECWRHVQIDSLSYFSGQEGQLSINLEGLCAVFTIDGVLARRVVVKLQGSDGHPVCAHALDLPGAKRNVYGPGCV